MTATKAEAPHILTPEEVQQVLFVMKQEIIDLYATVEQMMMVMGAQLRQYPIAFDPDGKAVDKSAEPAPAFAPGGYL